MGILSANWQAKLPDPAPPTVTAGSFNYLTAPQSIAIAFSADVSASLSVNDLVVQNLTTGQTVASANIALLNFNIATNTATFTFPGFPSGTLPDGNYRMTLPAGSVNGPGGGMLASSFSSDFFVLQGDVNHDRSVNTVDVSIVLSHFGQVVSTLAQGDVNYDGVVNAVDYNIVAARFGNSLPPLAAPLPAALPGPTRRAAVRLVNLLQ